MKKIYFSLTFLLMGLLYFLTLLPGLGLGDSAEFASLASDLRVAHPPGYPLYVLLGKIFVLIPFFPSPAYALNFSSLIFSLLSLFVFYKILINSFNLENKLALLITMTLASTPLYWRYSIIAEVFALNNLLMLLLIYETLHFHQHSSKASLLRGAFWMGLGLSHHHSMILIIIPCLSTVFWKLKPRPSQLGLPLLSFILGLTPYLLLPLRSQDTPLISWGDQSNLQGFLDHVFRREYGTFQLMNASSNASNSNFFTHSYLFAWELIKNSLGLIIIIPIFATLYFKIKKLPLSFYIILSCFLFYFIIFSSMSNGDLNKELHHEIQTRFWLAPLILSFLMLSFFIKPITPIILIPIILLNIGLNFKKENKSNQHEYEEAFALTIKNMPPNSLILSSGDVDSNFLRYLLFIEKIRPDIKNIDRGSLLKSWSIPYVRKYLPELQLPHPYNLLELLEGNIAKSVLFISPMTDYDGPSSLQNVIRNNFILLPWGPFYQVIKKPLSPSEEASLILKSFAHYESLPKPIGKNIRHPSWEAIMVEHFNNIQINLCIMSLSYLLTHPESPLKKDLAQASINLAQRILDNQEKEDKEYSLILAHKMIAGTLSTLPLSPLRNEDKDLIKKLIFHAQEYVNKGDKSESDYASYVAVLKHFQTLMFKE